MTSTLTLEMLPVELLVCIFGQLSPNDLDSSIRVSKSWYTIYSSQKLFILRSVARQAFHPAVYPYAVAAVKAPDPLAPGTHSTLSEADRRLEHRKFIRKYEKRRQLGDQLDLATCHSLCKLWILVENITHDYARDTLQKSYGMQTVKHFHNRPPPEAIFKFKLSCQEKARLQQAFVRFELLRRLYGPLGPYEGYEGRLERRHETEDIVARRRVRKERFIGYDVLWVFKYISKRWRRRYYTLYKESCEVVKGKVTKSQRIMELLPSFRNGWVARTSLYESWKAFGFLASLGLPFLSSFQKLSEEDQLSILTLPLKSSLYNSSVELVILDNLEVDKYPYPYDFYNVFYDDLESDQEEEAMTEEENDGDEENLEWGLEEDHEAAEEDEEEHLEAAPEEGDEADDEYEEETDTESEETSENEMDMIDLVSTDEEEEFANGNEPPLMAWQQGHKIKIRKPSGISYDPFFTTMASRFSSPTILPVLEPHYQRLGLLFWDEGRLKEALKRMDTEETFKILEDLFVDVNY